MQSIIKKVHVKAVEAGSSQRAARPAPGSAAEACEQGVRLLSEDGLVHAIEITCSCGEATLVELQYPAANASQPGAQSETAQ